MKIETISALCLGVLLSLTCVSCDRDESSVSVARDSERYEGVLAMLDNELLDREDYITSRSSRIDSLRSLRDSASGRTELDYTVEIAELYRGFLADSALVECRRGELIAGALGDSITAFEMRMERIQQMPLAGFGHEAVVEFERSRREGMELRDQIMFLRSGRQMYSYIAAQFPNFPDEKRRWNDKATALQERLVEMLEPDSPEMLLNVGELEFMRGNDSRAYAILTELLERIDRDSNVAARVASLVGQTAARQGRVDESLYYLAISAIADVRSATREVTSLQQLGIALYDKGDVERADFYLQEALASAVECHASMRMLQTSEAIPVISAAGRAAAERNRVRLYCILGVVVMLAAGLVVLVMRLRQEMRRQDALRRSLENANHAKEVYMSEFISLCTVYMNKLNRFCEIAARKISTGATDELYRLTKSGRFVEEQSRDFYEIFDNAFLHIYPDFVSKVNALLRDDCQIELAKGERLNTDLRILAFVRLGVEEGPKIAQALNYSVNTIYAYRNRLRNRAVRRDTFDDDVMNIR
ncbi:DUF6377 domain-containing protein [uncultured Muribaculum sp.]|uniref:DUF6377 domain-containing protein n=1 Tax=uncultured Muribaculum sp. TaxID=1918613 RepID=UPI0025F3CCAD|nr:DUF6377 domain-containing protein [uncultured Muribaculum sp.]